MKVTLVGKGVCFDTGGLDIKPSCAMALMKKDMGGAATTLALAAMLMDGALPAAAARAVADRRKFDFRKCFPHQRHLSQPQGSDGRDRQHRRRGTDLFSPMRSPMRAKTQPDLLFDFATLTGAARVALGPELPPFYTGDDALADEIAASGRDGERSSLAPAAVGQLRRRPRRQDIRRSRA